MVNESSYKKAVQKVFKLRENFGSNLFNGYHVFHGIFVALELGSPEGQKTTDQRCKWLKNACKQASKKGININDQNELGYTILHAVSSTMRCRPLILQVFMEAGSNPLLKTHDGKLCLDILGLLGENESTALIKSQMERWTIEIERERLDKNIEHSPILDSNISSKPRL